MRVLGDPRMEGTNAVYKVELMGAVTEGIPVERLQQGERFSHEFAPVETSKLAPVVAKVDLFDYFNDVAHQEELKKMKAALVKERKRLEEQITWDLIASKSPEFKEMLEAFRKAGGEL